MVETCFGAMAMRISHSPREEVVTFIPPRGKVPQRRYVLSRSKLRLTLYNGGQNLFAHQPEASWHWLKYRDWSSIKPFGLVRLMHRGHGDRVPSVLQEGVLAKGRNAFVGLEIAKVFIERLELHPRFLYKVYWVPPHGAICVVKRIDPTFLRTEQLKSERYLPVCT